jgi:hypothetical protein
MPTFYHYHSTGRVLTVKFNTKKNLPRTNALAHFAATSATEDENFWRRRKQDFCSTSPETTVAPGKTFRRISKNPSMRTSTSSSLRSGGDQVRNFSYQKLPKVTKSYQKLPKVTKSYQKLPMLPKVTKILARFEGIFVEIILIVLNLDA